MDRYKFLPCYHYVENEDGDIQNPATDKVRTCTIYGNHGKNLIPFPYVGQAGTQNGVTIAIDSDGVITLSGTATATIYFGLLSPVNSSVITKPGKYTISGMPGTVSGVSIQCYVDDTWESRYRDTGNGQTFTVTSSIKYVTIQINSGSVCDNVVIKPMLEESETKTDFEPWCGVGDMTKNIFDEQTILPQQGWVKQDDGSWYVSNPYTSYNKVLYDNTDGYVGQFYISFDYKYLSGTASIQGAIVKVRYTDGTEKEVQSPIFADWHSCNLCTEPNKVVSKILWSYGTRSQSTWVRNILIEKVAESNLIPYPYARTTQTISGVTLTDNGDGSITVNGTATANVWYPISTRTASTIYATKGTYYLSGCPSGGSGNKYWLQCDVYNGTKQIAGFCDAGNGKTQDLSAYDITTISVNIHVNSGTTVDNLTFRPLLVKMDDISGYEPYGYKIPVENDTRENLLNVDDFTATQTNSYYASKIITLTDSDMSTYLPHLDEMKGKSVVCSYDFDNEKFIQEFLIYFNETVNGSSNYIAFSNSNNFTTTLPDATPIRLEIRARSNSADLNGTAVKFSNISLKLADVDPETTNIYTPKQIMQGENMTFNEPFKLSKANQLSVETAVKPSAVKYTYYTY